MYPPLHEGGYELIWQDTVAYLGASHRVRVLTSDHRGAEAQDEGDVHRDLRWYWRDHEFRRPGLAARLRLERHNAAVLDHHLREFEPDVLSWWAMGGDVAWADRQGTARRPPIGRHRLRRLAALRPRVDAWTRPFRAGGDSGGWSSGRAAWRPGSTRAPSTPGCSSARRPGAAESAWALDATAVCHPGVSRGAFATAAPKAWRWRLLYVGRIDRRRASTSRSGRSPTSRRRRAS